MLNKIFEQIRITQTEHTARRATLLNAKNDAGGFYKHSSHTRSHITISRSQKFPNPPLHNLNRLTFRFLVTTIFSCKPVVLAE